MPVPTMEPGLFEVADPGHYQPGHRVWVFRDGAWRPGIVLRSSPRAVMVRYRPGEGSGTGVDTVTARSLAARTDSDPGLDAPAESVAVHPQRSTNEIPLTTV